MTQRKKTPRRRTQRTSHRTMIQSRMMRKRTMERRRKKTRKKERTTREKMSRIEAAAVVKYLPLGTAARAPTARRKGKKRGRKSVESAGKRRRRSERNATG